MPSGAGGKQLSQSQYLITFQCSLYLIAASHVRHFVYTDHTHLASLNYPDFDRKDFFTK
jgi:hypothetical protein